jgi:hypothetical protein
MRRRSNWLDDRAQERRRAIEACPHVDNPVDVANNGVVDAIYLMEAVRDLDPREVWGRLAIWSVESPIRLYAVTVALAAMVPSSHPVSELLKWTDQLTSPDRVGAIRSVLPAPAPPQDLPRDARLRAARAAYARGVREAWVVEGNREYERRRKQRHRDRQKGAA